MLVWLNTSFYVNTFCLIQLQSFAIFSLDRRDMTYTSAMTAIKQF